MRTSRREFSVSDKVAMFRRATNSSGQTQCEKCGIWVKSRKDYEFHHLVPEAMRPTADRKRKLGPADGRLWCLKCHGEQTPRDVDDINEAKRREARELLLVQPGRRKAWWRHTKDQKPPLKVASGLPGLARRGFGPA